MKKHIEEQERRIWREQQPLCLQKSEAWQRIFTGLAREEEEENGRF
jgi:hypothetical protein